MGYGRYPRQNCEDECKARGVGLKHMHSSTCDHGHSAAYCCDCMVEFIHLTGCTHRSEPVPSLVPPVAIVRNVTKDHQYQFTVAGFCGECGGVQDDHPLIGVPDPMTGCDVDHNSLSPKQLIGDDGLELSRCPRCSVQVEPRLAQGFAKGPGYGRGRLPFTKRHMAELEVLRAAWVGGFYLS